MSSQTCWCAALAWGRRGALFLLLGGCALTSKASPLSARYFSPELQEATGASPASGTPIELRIGRVEAAAQLEQRIAYRASESELGYYESWRWTEPPEAYLARELSLSLFERRGFIHVVAGAAPTLDVQLLSFEEVRGGELRARVELRFVLRDDRRSLLERTLRIEQPLASGPADEAPLRLTKALSGALQAGVAKLADLVTAELQR